VDEPIWKWEGRLELCRLWRLRPQRYLLSPHTAQPTPHPQTSHNLIYSSYTSIIRCTIDILVRRARTRSPSSYTYCKELFAPQLRINLSLANNSYSVALDHYFPVWPSCISSSIRLSGLERIFCKGTPIVLSPYIGYCKI